MNAYIKTENSEFAREPVSSAVLNIDIPSYKKYNEERKRILKMEHLAEDVKSLQNDMGDIKMLLQQLVNGKPNG